MYTPSLTPSSCFLTQKKSKNIVIYPLNQEKYKEWIKKQSKNRQNTLKNKDFNAKVGELAFLHKDNGDFDAALVGISSPCGIYDLSIVSQSLKSSFSDGFLDKVSFTLSTGPSTSSLKTNDLHNALCGWAFGLYKQNLFRKNPQGGLPRLVWPKDCDKKSVLSSCDAACHIRDLINLPANHLGPDALEKDARKLAKKFDAKTTTIKGKALVDKNFPLIHMVGKAGEQAPRLVDMRWGQSKAPKLTIVGKGVCFDTGGLNIKPGAYMKAMKKDMGGAAHAIGLARLIMNAKLNVRLRVLLPIVENNISANAFRPGDVSIARNGDYVENTNTDAEGRLILADSLTYACEERPDLLIDFATLTGSARAALGPDIPAFFSSNEKRGTALQKIALQEHDPIWQMPLWSAYKKHIKSKTGDIVNSAGLPGDLIYSALFLQNFVSDDVDWMHFDMYAWEHTGIPGRPAGGAEQAIRGIFAYLQKEYG